MGPGRELMDRLAGGRIGVVFGSLTPAEELARGAALAEELGFGDVWTSSSPGERRA
jgi:hypothetical protein